MIRLLFLARSAKLPTGLYFLLALISFFFFFQANIFLLERHIMKTMIMKYKNTKIISFYAFYATFNKLLVQIFQNHFMQFNFPQPA